MQINNSRFLLLFIVVAFLLSSCGIVSKSRYGNGFSLDLFESKAKGFDSARLHELRPKSSHYKSKKTRKGISLSQTEMQDSFQNEVKESQQNDKKAFVTSKRIVKKQEELLQKHSQSIDMVDVIEEPPLPDEKDQKNSEEGEVDAHSRVALILFISSMLLLFFIVPLSVVGFFVAVRFAISSLKRISRAEKDGKIMKGKAAAIWVLVLSAILMLWVVILFIAAILFFF